LAPNKWPDGSSIADSISAFAIGASRQGFPSPPVAAGLRAAAEDLADAKRAIALSHPFCEPRAGQRLESEVRVRLQPADDNNESCLVMQDIEGNEFDLG
jgi:hypothetical protein